MHKQRVKKEDIRFLREVLVTRRSQRRVRCGKSASGTVTVQTYVRVVCDRKDRTEGWGLRHGSCCCYCFCCWA